MIQTNASKRVKPRVYVAVLAILAALAIIDDLGAILVIALFYTSEISMGALGMGIGAIGVAVIGNLMGIRTPIFYAMIGIIADFCRGSETLPTVY